MPEDKPNEGKSGQLVTETVISDAGPEPTMKLDRTPKGFKFAGVRCGLKNKRNDLGILFCETPCRAAGVVTQNQVRSATVDLTETVLKNGNIQAIVINSGNANCCTGVQGQRDARQMAALVAEGLKIDPASVAVASTGIIGQFLDMAKVEEGIKQAIPVLGDSPKNFMEAMLTTDLVEKQACAEIGSGSIIYGVAKGSGMIAPNMATMLAFIVTDANTSGIDLQTAMTRVCNHTFNRCTVDGDTSTNDMCLLLANGKSEEKIDEQTFEEGLYDVCLSLAKKIARDGEGATKLIEVTVQGSPHPEKIARSIAESPLVKTAMFGCDPNWGRILMAAGKAGVEFDPLQAKLTLMALGESHLLYENGSAAAFDPQRVSAGLKSDHIVITLRLGPGKEATFYTCDMGYGYVRINSEYHT